MADLQDKRDTRRRLSAYDMVGEWTVKTSETIYQGSGVALSATGVLVDSKDADAVKTVGRAAASVITAAAGTKLKVDQGIFGYDKGVGTIVPGVPVYWTDNQTVNGNSGVFAGYVYDVEDDIVWVLQTFDMVEPAAG